MNDKKKREQITLASETLDKLSVDETEVILRRFTKFLGDTVLCGDVASPVYLVVRANQAGDELINRRK